MGSYRNRFCILSSQDAESYTKTGVRPGCLDHEHISRDLALILTGTVLYSKMLPDGSEKSVFEYDYVRKAVLDDSPYRIQAITNSDPRTWGIRRSGGLYGCEVHQLLHVGK